MASLTQLHLPWVEAGNSGARGQRDVTGAEGRGVKGVWWSGIGVRVKSRASSGQELGYV
jgi:hypothetical protein